MVNSEKLRQKSVFTTGDVAQICNISQQTVIRCFDTGKLGGFRVPGSRFRRIPRERLIEFMERSDIPLEKLGGVSRRVLVVDDEPAIVSLLTDLLERDGRYVTRSTGSGFEAGILTQEFAPEVILLDFKLPDINGTEVCRMIRSRPDLQGIRIIIISGVAASEEIEELFEAGADDFIKKPFHIDDVLDRIERVLRV